MRALCLIVCVALGGCSTAAERLNADWRDSQARVQNAAYADTVSASAESPQEATLDDVNAQRALKGEGEMSQSTFTKLKAIKWNPLDW